MGGDPQFSMATTNQSATVSRSIWLPVGRANFYSYTTNGWLLGDFNTDAKSTTCTSRLLEPTKHPTYTPSLQVSVLRRVIEVLARSFGYDSVGECELSDAEVEGMARPVAVTMTLTPTRKGLSDTDRTRRANEALVDARVSEVKFRADENGFYAITAVGPNANRAKVSEALDTHISEVFGGTFSLGWQRRSQRRHQAGANGGDGATAPTPATVDGGQPETNLDAPARDYNGLPERLADGTDEAEEACYPRGVLTFFQLNTLFEGIFNDSLTPAIFFEQHDFMERFIERTEQASKAQDDPAAAVAPASMSAASSDAKASLPGGTSVLQTMADMIKLLTTKLNTTASPHTIEDDLAKLLTLRHFLAVTSREALQSLKWSVESVRRGLLDEMMGILHRESRLTQLKLDQLPVQEWTPEVAIGANESQLRGYAMLAGAKMPLISNVHRLAMAAAGRVNKDIADVREGGLADASGGAGAKVELTEEEHGRLDSAEEDLTYRLSEWDGLVTALNDNIGGLQKAVEHAWMERLLYEQEQTRAEQEAMAEIERSRSSRPVVAPIGGGYNLFMLFFTILAAVFAAGAIPESYKALGAGDSDGFGLLTYVGFLAGLAVFVWVSSALIDRARRWKREKHNASDSYVYEFAFRLDEVVDTDKVLAHVQHKPPRASRRFLRRRTQSTNDLITAHDEAEAKKCRTLDSLHLDRSGGVRIELVSRESTLIKVHFVAGFRTRKAGAGRFSPRRAARFEIINELLAHKVSEQPQYVLRECRVFGDSPRPLEPGEVLDLVTFVLNTSALVLVKNTELTAADVLKYATRILVGDK